MRKILNTSEAIKLAQKLKIQKKTIVLVGGYFDILHSGHIKFLEAAKKQADYLFVLLEEDSKAKKEKGKTRPVNSQQDRAKILSSLGSIDYVIMLKNMTNNSLYDRLIVELHPNVIATTDGDPNIEHKQRQAKLIQSKIVNVIERIDSQSSTKYIKLINQN